MMSACDELGVGKEQASLGVPLGIVLCQPSTCILIVVLMMYSAKTYGMGADAAWYASLVLSTFLYSVAAAPVPGGMLICYGLLFAELGIPAEALVCAAAIDVILDYVVTSGRIGGTILIVVDAARSMGAINKSKLEPKADIQQG
jgi:Na+/H+-dicarboxylate symporter